MRTIVLALALLAACTDPVGTTAAPAEAGAHASLLASPGFFGSSTPTPLHNDSAIAELIGFADRDYPAGEAFEVLWRQATPAAVGWAELALATGPVALGNPTVTVVGARSIVTELTYQGSVTVEVKLGLSVVAGEGRWAVVAVWTPPGGTEPRVVGSLVLDPIGSGAIAVQTVPGYKPSEVVGQPWTFDAQQSTRPIALMARAP